MNRYLAELSTELKKNVKTPPASTDFTDKRTKVGKVSTSMGCFSKNNLPTWCSGACSSLIELDTPQGKLTGCRQEFDDQISWVRLSFMKSCPLKNGRAAMNDQGWPSWYSKERKYYDNT